MRKGRLLVLLLPLIGLAACGDEAAFGSGRTPELQAAEDRSLDLSGTDGPAALSRAQDGAKATVAIVNVVSATAEVFGELGDAVGDLFPDEDNPCPDGGSAASDLGGSLNRPKLRMEFYECRRGEFLLDGVATIRCDDFSGSDCSRGQATLGENGANLLYRSSVAAQPRQILMQGYADLFLDEAARHLAARATLQGELRAVDGSARYSFVTEALDIDVREVADDRQEVRLGGVAGIGGGTEAASCIRGRYDTETVEPLIVSGRRVQGGRLRHYSPPPRPGTQAAESLYVEDALDARIDGGEAQVFTAEELAQFCALSR